jgi:hypothetical protein
MMMMMMMIILIIIIQFFIFNLLTQQLQEPVTDNDSIQFFISL